MEQYIFYPKLNFDLVRIKEIIERQMSLKVPGHASHQRRVRDEPYLLELQEQYPFLSNLYNIYTTAPNYKTPIHICPDRGCAINIPIIYTEDSHTIFYEIKKGAKTEYIEERIYKVIKEEDAVEVFRYTLDRPTLMNTQLPHGVIGGPLRARTIMSWSVILDSNYETTKNKLMSML
jgi:hypothetical protein